MRQQVIIHWGISSFFGWGVYGLNLALAWAEDPEILPTCSRPIRLSEVSLDPLRMLRLQEFLQDSSQFDTQLREYSAGNRHAVVDVPLLAGLGDDFRIAPTAYRMTLAGSPTIGVTFFENPDLRDDAIARALAFDCIIAGSTWNERVLRQRGVHRVSTILQGIDPTLFHQAPRTGYYGGRFLVFSGGKLERRKGQDIVLAAFSRFAQKHPDALLVTAWHSPWPQFAKSLDTSNLMGPVHFTPEGKVDVRTWAIQNGVPSHQIVDLGAVPNALMPPILREMDVAVFPNRGEGGTNLVAMECMACGVPVILSANTGHLDLIAEDRVYPLWVQGRVEGMNPNPDGLQGWGESSVEEVIENLERIYLDRKEAACKAAQAAEWISEWTWQRTADSVKKIVLDHRQG